MMIFTKEGPLASVGRSQFLEQRKKNNWQLKTAGRIIAEAWQITKDEWHTKAFTVVPWSEIEIARSTHFLESNSTFRDWLI